MYSILPSNENSDTHFEINIQHLSEANQLDIRCNFNNATEVLFELIAEGSPLAFYKKSHRGGENILIDLNSSKSCSYTLKLRNSDGIEVDSYIVMKSFC